MSTGAPSRTEISCTAEAPCRVDLAGGTLDIWPLYLFHPGAVTVNFAVDILTRCQITPHKSPEVHLRSLDTGKEDFFPDLSAVVQAKTYKHSLAGYLCRFFFSHSEPTGQGFTL